jgi:phosphatidylglycerol:prolipoprotein diacylglycerol transferase
MVISSMERRHEFSWWLFGVLGRDVFFAKRYKLPFWQVIDFVAVLVPTGLLFGRIGNFIGGELWGRPVVDPNYPLAMVFPHVDNLRATLRNYTKPFWKGRYYLHYGGFRSKPRPVKAVSGVFALGYGLRVLVLNFLENPMPTKDLLPLAG